MEKEYRLEELKRRFGDRLLFVVINGSRAYGTNIDSSDTDLRGVAIDSESSVFGLSKMDHYENKEYDTVIYSLKKFLSLLNNSNPNMLEYLGSSEEDILYVSELGKILFDNIDLFLSKDIQYKYFYFSKNLENDLYKLLKKGHINDEKLCENINKTAMNVIRVLNTGADLLNGNIFITKRPEAEELKKIRLGKYLEGEKELSLKQDYYDMLEESKINFQKAVKNTKLKNKVDNQKVDDLCIRILKQYYK